MIQIAIVIIFTTLIVRGLLSFKTKRDDYSISMEELKSEFKKKDILLLLGSFVLIPLLIVGLTIFYSRLSDLQFANDEGVIYLINSNIGIWILMAMMTSVGVGFCIIFWITKKMFKERVDVYWIYYNRKYGFNAAGFLKYFSILIMVSGLLLTCMSYNYFVKIKDDSLEINRFVSLLPETYTFDSIEQITHYQKKNCTQWKCSG